MNHTRLQLILFDEGRSECHLIIFRLDVSCRRRILSATRVQQNLVQLKGGSTKGERVHILMEHDVVLARWATDIAFLALSPFQYWSYRETEE